MSDYYILREIFIKKAVGMSIPNISFSIQGVPLAGLNMAQPVSALPYGRRSSESDFESLVRKVIQSVKDHPFLFCGSLTTIYVVSEIYSLYHILFEPIRSSDYDNLFQQLICEWFDLMTPRQAQRIHC